MANYKIQIGAELRTKDIDSAINSYKKPLKLSAKLDTSDIDSQIASYKVGNKVEVLSKLNTKGITDVIEKYQAKKPIKVNAELDIKDIDNKIANYQTKSPIKVNVELNKSSINQQIKGYQTGEYIKIDAKLNDSAISDAIKNYQSKSKIKVDLDLNYSDIEKKISDYEVRSPLRVKVKINKTDINQQIKDYGESDQYITVKAKLDNGAVTEAIKNYKAKTPITVDLKLNSDNINEILQRYNQSSPLNVDAKVNTANIGTQIKNYFAKNAVRVGITLNDDDITKKIAGYKTEIPITVKVKLDDASLNSQIASYKSKKFVELGAVLDTEFLDKMIGSYTAKTPIKVGVKLDGKNISEQVKTLKTDAPIEFVAKLDENSINQAIANYKQNVPIKLNVELNDEDINRQISAYKAKAPIQVSVKLDDSDINDELGKHKISTPIQVGVKLDREKLNEQIRNFTTKTKIKIGIKLDSKGITEQIRKIEPKTKIKVGIQLDKNDIAQQINNINTTTPIKLGVELDHNGVQGVQNQINNLRQQIQQLGNIAINLGGNTARSNANQKYSNNSVAGGRKEKKQADDTARAYRELISLQNRLASKQRKVASLGLDTSQNQREVLALSNTIDDLIRRYQRIHQLFNGRFNDAQVDSLNRGFQRVSENLNEISAKADDARNALARSINTELGNGGFEKQIVKIEGDISRLQNVSDKVRMAMDEVRLAFGFMQDASTNGSVDDLIAANRLYEESLKTVKNQLDINKVSNSSSIETQTRAYKELLSISKEINSLEINIAKLKGQGGNSNQIEVLENQLRTLQSTYKQLVTTMDTPLSDDQWSSIYTQIAKTQEELAALGAKFVDTQAKIANGISTSSSMAMSQNQFSKAKSDFDKLVNASSEVKVAFDGLKVSYTNLTNAQQSYKSVMSNEAATDEQKLQAINNLINANDRYQNALKTTNNLIAENARIEKDSAANQKLQDDRLAFQTKIDAWLAKNSAAEEQFGAKLRQLRADAQSCDRVTLNHLEAEFRQIDAAAEAAGKKTQTFVDRIKNQFQRYSSYLSVASVIMYAGQAMRDMFEQVKLIDSAMTELKKVTNETDESYNQFLSNAALRSKELGTTIDGLVSSTADFARLGYGFKESQGLAEVANIYAVVGDEIEGVEDATQSLVSTIAAFKGEMNDMSNSEFAMGIVDKMNEVSNNFAISSGGIGEALQRSASSMAAANNTLDETIAMITAANEVAQNPEKVGNAMKTKFLYNCLNVQKCA